MKPAASVIIPVRNRLNDLAELLDQLDEQTRTDFEVVVIDDASDVPVADALAGRDHPYALHFERLADSKGIGRARNAGVHRAQADVLVFIDSDGAVSDPRWLEKHLALHDDGHAHEAEGLVVTSRVDGIHDTYAGYSFGYSNWFMCCARHAAVIRDHHVPMHNTSTTRSVFERVGLFDEDLQVAEDVDWSFRCLRHGVRLMYVPDIPVGHKDRQTWSELWSSFRKMGRNAALVRQKNLVSPYRWLFPVNRLTGYLDFLPLTTLMTAYIVFQWLPREPRVLVYLPGLYVANVAYYAGLMDVLRGR